MVRTRSSSSRFLPLRPARVIFQTMKEAETILQNPCQGKGDQMEINQDEGKKGNKKLSCPGEVCNYISEFLF